MVSVFADSVIILINESDNVGSLMTREHELNSNEAHDHRLVPATR